MELHITAGVARADAELSLPERYLARLPPAHDAAVTDMPGGASGMAGEGGGEDQLAKVHLRLGGADADPANPALGSIATRLRMAFVDAVPAADAALDTHVPAAAFAFAPPLCRAAMVPTAWGPLNPLQRWFQAVLRRRRDWVERRPDNARHPWTFLTPC